VHPRVICQPRLLGSPFPLFVLSLALSPHGWLPAKIFAPLFRSRSLASISASLVPLLLPPFPAPQSHVFGCSMTLHARRQLKHFTPHLVCSFPPFPLSWGIRSGPLALGACNDHGELTVCRGNACAARRTKVVPNLTRLPLRRLNGISLGRLVWGPQYLGSGY